MKISFEMPSQEVPKKEEKPAENIPPNVADLKITFGKPSKKEVPGIGSEPRIEVQKKDDDRKVDWIPGRAKGRREPGKSLVEFQERKQALEAIAASFFEKYPYAKASFEKEPEMMRDFRAGLAVLMDSSLKNAETTPAGLQDDERFLKEVLKLSFKIEDEGKDRKRAAGRKAESA